jgi:hypothetical protein
MIRSAMGAATIAALVSLLGLISLLRFATN